MSCNKILISAFLILSVFFVQAQTTPSESGIYTERLELSNNIEIYPNPAVDYIVVEIENSTLQDAQFELHSLIGNEIRIQPQPLGDGKYRITLKNYASGYYFLVVKDERLRFKKAYRFLKN